MFCFVYILANKYCFSAKENEFGRRSEVLKKDSFAFYCYRLRSTVDDIAENGLIAKKANFDNLGLIEK